MKEKLVIAFFWLAIANFALVFAGQAMDAVGLTPLEWVLDFLQFFIAFLMAIVAIRVLCEIAIAIFRINDNVSPDGGKSETADIDVIKEALKAADDARKAAEDAAKKATAATKAAVARNKTDDSDIDIDIDVKPDPKPAVKKKAVTKKKPAVKKPAAKKPAAGLKKDGTPRKKPGPKAKD